MSFLPLPRQAYLFYTPLTLNILIVKDIVFLLFIRLVKLLKILRARDLLPALHDLYPYIHSNFDF
jgi:hypothetical protein